MVSDWGTLRSVSNFILFLAMLTGALGKKHDWVSEINVGDGEVYSISVLESNIAVACSKAVSLYKQSTPGKRQPHHLSLC